jgi:iron(III) transport system permease protein
MAPAPARALPRLLTTRAGSEGQLGLFVVVLVLLVAFIVYPLVQVLVVSVASPAGPTLEHFAAFFARPLFLEALGNTLLAGVAAVGFGSLVALPLAVLVARYDFPGRALIQTLAVLPLVIPPFVGAVA